MTIQRGIARPAVLVIGIILFGVVAAMPSFSTLPQQLQSAPPQSASAAQGQPAKAGAAMDVPVEEIIKKFAEKEAEFRDARNNYVYTQTFLVQDSGRDGQGEFRMTSDITFTPEGKRYEKVTYAPPSSLVNIMLSAEDFKDLQGVQPFVLTTEDLPKYTVEYAGREHVDELSTYVFKVGPKKIEKGQRYFQGTVWVDDQDLQIVKSLGKAVPETRKKDNENLFPTFETYREQIDGKYWFPTYTRADDTLHFSTGDVRIHMVVRYTNYKQFRSTIRIIPLDQPPKKP